MAKKVLIISTSFRGGSNSYVLAKECAKGAKEAGHDVELLSLKGKDIKYCVGCLSCQKTGICVLKDDVADIMAKVKDADIPMEILRERDWGKYTGMPVSEAADKYKKDGRWMFPDGDAETEEDIYQRAGKALQELSEKFANDTIIVVTHGQFARNMIANHFECNYHEVTSFVNAEIRMLNL